MELTCELAPGYLASVYRVMVERLESGDLVAIEQRLDELDWGPGELERLAADYEALHRHLKSEAPRLYEEEDPGAVDWRALLSEDHASVASWLLVGELSAGRIKSYDFHLEVRDRASDMQTQLGSICCWVLGRPVLPWPIAPAVPSLKHPISAVMRAYDGLLQHLANLGTADTEMPITSVIWRVGALVDGIIEAQAQPDSLARRFGQMRKRLLPVLTSGEQRPVDLVVNDLADKRNVLTHLHPEGGVTFESVVDLHTDLESIVDHINAITLGTFFSIAAHHADRPPPKGEVRQVEEEISAMISALA